MEILLSLLAVHFVADFLLQTNWMAINKSKNWMALTAHVGVYSAVFAGLLGLTFGLITFITHFLTDALTSRMSRKCFPWEPVSRTIDAADWRPVYVDHEGEGWHSRHWFFCVIGLDQLIHAATLAWTWRCVFG